MVWTVLLQQHKKAMFAAHLQRQQLLCHHAEHLQPDAVELVEASPGATLRQATEKLGHELQQHNHGE
jgi:predicted glycosyltransferase